MDLAHENILVLEYMLIKLFCMKTLKLSPDFSMKQCSCWPWEINEGDDEMDLSAETSENSKELGLLFLTMVWRD